VSPVVSAVLVVFVVLVTLGGPTQAQDAGSPPTAGPRIELVGQRAVVSPGDTLDLELRPFDLPSEARLSFSLYSPVTTTTRLDETIRGTRLGRPLQRVGDLPAAFLLQSDNSLRASFPIDDREQPALGFRLTRAGVYPLEVALDGPDGETLDRFVTHIVRLPRSDIPSDDTATLAVNVVVPVAAPLATEPDGTINLAPADRERLRTLAGVVANQAGPALTLDVNPETVDALAADSATADVVDALRRGASSDGIQAATYVPLSLNAWFSEQLGRDLAAQYQAGSATLAEHLGVTDPQVATVVADDQTGPLGLEGLRTLGARSAVVPATAVSSPPDTTVAQPFDVVFDDATTVRAVAADTSATERLLADEPPMLAAQHTIAELSLRRDEAGATPQAIVLVLPAQGDIAAPLAALLTQFRDVTDGGASGRTILTPDTLTNVVDVEPARNRDGSVPQRRWTAPVTTNLGSYPQSLSQAHVSVDGYRSMVEGVDDARVKPLEQALLVSGDRSLSDRRRQDYLDAATATVNAAANAVAVPDGQSVTLTARDATIPLTVENNADHPLRVTVTLQSEKLIFPDGNRVTAVLQPGSNRLETTVRVRVSGAFPMDLAVTSPDERINIATGRVGVRSTAVSGIGLALSIGAGVFLLVWWGKHLRRGRRQHRLVDTAEHPAIAEASPASPTV
jgi:hypothetical protein